MAQSIDSGLRLWELLQNVLGKFSPRVEWQVADPYEITWHPEGVPIFEEGSEAWIDHYARLHALTFDGMMHCARRFLEEGKQTTIQLKVNRGPDVTQGNMMKFWQHYERVTFSRVPEEKKGRFIGYT